MGISARKFHTTDACIACKRCEKACPMNNIVMVGWKPVWEQIVLLVWPVIISVPKMLYNTERDGEKGQYFNPNEK